MGRFTMADPTGLSATVYATPTTWNRYLYTNADPINLLDPSGTTCINEKGYWVDNNDTYGCSDVGKQVDPQYFAIPTTFSVTGTGLGDDDGDDAGDGGDAEGRCPSGLELMRDGTCGV